MSLVNTTTSLLPSGDSFIVSGQYTAGDSAGVTALAVAAGISCISVGVLLVLLVVSASRRFQAPGQVVFVRTHVAPYFISLLFCDFWQSIGSLLSVHWVSNGRVFLGTTCTSQAAIKNGGNVGTAIWSLAISLHVFFVLFLGRRPWEPALYITLILNWTLIGFIIVLGPGIIQNTAAHGPYFGVSGLWCWITEQYPMSQLMLEYFWMFVAAFTSIILYLLVFLKLRGNLIVKGWHWRLRRAEGKTWDPAAGQTSLQAQVTSITRHMMMFPVVYFLVVLPMAGCRYAMWAGYVVPFQLIIFADVIFVLQGFINVVLFCCTRSVIPADHENLFGPGHRGSKYDDEESTVVAPGSLGLASQSKPQKIKRVNHIISIEPARMESSRSQESRQTSRANSLYETAQEQQEQWAEYHPVPATSHSPRLTMEEMGKINANYAQGPSRSGTPIQQQSSRQVIPPRSRSPFRVVNATETIMDEPEEQQLIASVRPLHIRKQSSMSSIGSYMSDDSSAPLTATTTRGFGRSLTSNMRRDSGLAFEWYSDHVQVTPPPVPTHPSFTSIHRPTHSTSSSLSSFVAPPMISIMHPPKVMVSAASPMSPPQRGATPPMLSLDAARRAPPDSVPHTARPPTPMSHDSHGTHDSGSGTSVYL